MGRFQSSLGLRRQRRERRRVVISQVRQNLAIQVDPGFLQPVHEPAVRQLRQARPGSNADNPQGPEIALLQLAADVSVFERLLHRFLRGTVQLALGEEKALRQGECLFAVMTPLGTTFNSWHVFISLIKYGWI